MKSTRSLETNRKIWTFLTYFFLILGALIMVFPFVWMILTSSKTVPESVQIPPAIFPAQWMLDNFKNATDSLPSQIFIIPQYQMVAKMGMANTIFALVFPGLVSASGVFFLRQTYMSIPDEISEAAYLGGCNQFQAFYKVMFPLTGTSVAALTIFTTNFPVLMAGSLLAMLPMVILYLIFQKQFVEGIAGTGGK